MKRASLLLLASISLLCFTSPARAEDKKPVEVALRIKSRVPRPMVAIEIQRVLPALGVNDLGKPLLYRIEEAASKEPF